ncbi:MAG: hypothetical protein WAN99_08020 [Methanoculleus sp.]
MKITTYAPARSARYLPEMATALPFVCARGGDECWYAVFFSL